jgi:integrase
LSSYGVEKSSDRVLSLEEIANLWPWLAADDVPPDCRDVLRLELALGARCGELAGMTADEIDTTNEALPQTDEACGGCGSDRRFMTSFGRTKLR